MARTSLLLPQVEVTSKHDLGVICHVLENQQEVAVTSVFEIQVSPRRKENLHKLADGRSLIVTNRKVCARPEGVDGVLQEVDGDKLAWLSHKGREEFQEALDTNGWVAVRTEIAASWQDAFLYRSEIRDEHGAITVPGLRPPQIGGLHAIGAHWSLSDQPATLVMPTGTGKTETMLAALVAFVSGTLLVVVPSRALRDQTARKFLTLGLLRSLNTLSPGARNPVVGILSKRPSTEDQLDIFEKSNVVVGTMSALGQGTAANLVPQIANRVGVLAVDEAHHVPANTWSAYREQFQDRKVVQFTATPFRRDGKLVDGKVIYNYPLHIAQRDGYFRHIDFRPVFEVDPDDGDRAIAGAATKQLQHDLAAGSDHIVMARCDSISRAETVHRIYEEIGGAYKPVLVHSDLTQASSILDQLRSRQSRIVVCVDMLGEGFDLPQLKIAAVHDTHKSLAVILQFIGRFTRTTSTGEVGDATVIANIANQDVSTALERLYSEDADWNLLLREYSSEAIKEHFELVEFLNASKRLGDVDSDEPTDISPQLLRPKFSTVVYTTGQFHPKKFFEGLPKGVNVPWVWLHESSRTLYFVVCTEPTVAWSRSRKLRDRQWDLFVMHHDAGIHLLYLHSTDKSSVHEKLAQAVGGNGVRLISGDAVFRSLGGINRLIFHNVGVRKHGRRNLRYAMYTGSDVAEALSISERAGSVKSNLFGSGWEDGKPVTIGCSLKGRVWSREQGTVPAFVRWCKEVGLKLQDESIDTTRIIDNVLIPEEIDRLPNVEILSLDWPDELLHQSEDRVTLSWSDQEAQLSTVELQFQDVDRQNNALRLNVVSGTTVSSLALVLGGTTGYRIERLSRTPVTVQVGRIVKTLEEYLTDYPPLVRYMDLSELDGNLLIRPKELREIAIPGERFEVWDWAGTDIGIESIWKAGVRRQNSIQERSATHYRDGGFEVVFDDDASGEAADLICFKEDTDKIRVSLVHCKYSGGKDPGERVRDVVEVCSQAVRSTKWKWRFRDLCGHIVTREKLLATDARPSRFLTGDLRAINRLVRQSRFKEIRVEIVIVQPGLSKGNRTVEQTAVLAAAHSFLKETVDVDLDVVCSA